MSGWSDFSRLEALSATHGKKVWRAIRLKDGARVILKSWRTTHTRNAKPLLAEAAFLSKNTNSHLPQLIDQLDLEDHCLLVFEDIDAISLKDVIRRGAVSISQSVEIVRQLLEALQVIHHAGLRHGSLSSEHVVWSPASHRAQLVGLSSLEENDEKKALSASILSFPTYVAPERTGHGELEVDHRADLYSVGVILYELLGGRPPFEAKTITEVLLAHLTQEPLPISEHVVGIPVVVELFVHRLLSKRAEDRFQSCREALEAIEKANQSLYDQQPQEKDSIQFSSKLFGREDSLKSLTRSLLAARERSGVFKVILGEVESGKTSLARQLAEKCVNLGGIAAYGAPDVSTFNTPYPAIESLLSSLIQSLRKNRRLVEDLRRERRRLTFECSLIRHVFPEIEQLLPDLPKTEGPFLLERFSQALRYFFSWISQRTGPLLLILDDFQWAEPETVALVDSIRSATPRGVFLLVLSQTSLWPDDEILLPPLSPRSVMRLISETLGISDPNSSRILHEKSAGNPGLLIRFLEKSLQSGALRYSTSLKRWRIDDVALKSLTVEKSEEPGDIEEGLKQVLGVAACLGSRFRMDELAQLSERAPEVLSAWLQKAQLLEIICPLNSGSHNQFAFRDERLRKHHYDTIAPLERTKLHLRIARRQLLLDPHTLSSTDLNKTLGHFNRSLQLITHPRERKLVARLNLTAARQAISVTAFPFASVHLGCARALLGEEAWETDYQLCLEVYNESVRAALFESQVFLLEGFVGVISEHARSPIDRAESLEAKVQAAIAQGRHTQGIRETIRFLTELGMEPPSDPGAISQRLTSLLTKTSKLERSSWLSLPEAAAPEKLYYQRFLAGALSISYAMDRGQWSWLVCELVSKVLEDGLTIVSSHGLFHLSVFALLQAKDLSLYIKLKQAARDLIGQYHSGQAIQATLVGGVTGPRVRPLEETFELLEDAIYMGSSLFEREYVGYCEYFLCAYRWLSGTPLPELLERVEESRERLNRQGRPVVSEHLGLISRFATRQMNLSPERSRALSLEREAPIDPGSTRLRQVTALLSALLDELCCGAWHSAREISLHYPPEPSLLSGLYSEEVLFVLHLISRLVGLERWSESSEIERDFMAQGRSQWEKTVSTTPVNRLGYLSLIEAEWHRLDGEVLSALSSYEEVIKRNDSPTFLKGISATRAMLLCEDRGLLELAETYRETCDATMKRWRSSSQRGKKSRRKKNAQTVKERLHELHRLIADVIELSRLHTKEQHLSLLCRHCLSRGEPSRIAVLLYSKDQLTLRGFQHQGEESLQLVNEGEHQEWRRLLPASLIELTAQSGETIYLDRAERSFPFHRDEFLQSHHPSSCLCVPLLTQERALGVVYLESEVSNAFSEDERGAIDALVAQASVTLENTRLYDALGQAQKDLTTQSARLRRALNEVNRASVAKSSFLARMSHELRTPMNAILGFAQLGLDEMNPDRALHQVFEVVKESGEMLIGILNDVLELARLESGRVTLKNDEVHLGDFLERISGFFSQEAFRKSLVFRSPNLEKNQAYVEFDAHKVDLVLRNLLENAIRFTAQGEVRLQTKLSGGHDRDLLSFVVSDTGPGMDTGTINQYLDPLSSKYEGSGSGLGLAICQQYTSLLGGDLQIESAPGAGTKATLHIPVKITQFQVIQKKTLSEELLQTSLLLLNEETRALVEKMLDACDLDAIAELLSNAEEIPEEYRERLANLSFEYNALKLAALFNSTRVETS